MNETNLLIRNIVRIQGRNTPYYQFQMQQHQHVNKNYPVGTWPEYFRLLFFYHLRIEVKSEEIDIFMKVPQEFHSPSLIFIEYNRRCRK